MLLLSSDGRFVLRSARKRFEWGGDEKTRCWEAVSVSRVVGDRWVPARRSVKAVVRTRTGPTSYVRPPADSMVGDAEAR